MQLILGKVKEIPSKLGALGNFPEFGGTLAESISESVQKAIKQSFESHSPRGC